MISLMKASIMHLPEEKKMMDDFLLAEHTKLYIIRQIMDDAETSNHYKVLKIREVLENE